ncbi:MULTISPECIES: hypothetical protein [unclassified Rhodococcus (in: high G+C Gram-positive bacteria)]|uniref:hypothetical protein n=1 Tax=unclassified Rhodococcus (in: high G+C Gram-positive bacteria) TaxID=192944 RepID=UPI00163B2B58|nr:MULTISPECIES: hypothetical protein [unclassified Rhodococcus (in: high G+C Gram-positive bacteria)]MBC2640182.1 hypothetical protein [Rhodococcus sp. 3A]MBC2895071.1 hypothetical protein [Rhodococcus sp. 4CII]
MASASTGIAGASPPMAPLWDRGEVIGAAVLAFAGIAWFGWAQEDPPASWTPYLVAGQVISAVLLVVLLVLLVRGLTTSGSAMADPRVRRRYWVTVAVEVALIVGGNLLLAAVGHQAYDAAWTLFVVGVHFVPLGKVFHARALALAGVVVAVAAVAAAGLGLVTDLAPSAAAGAGGGVVFIGYAGWVLGRGRRPVRKGDARRTTPGTAHR